MLPKVFKIILPHLQKYVWYVARARDVATFVFPKIHLLQEKNIEIVHITEELLEAIEIARPSYSKQAVTYLACGHIGLAAMHYGKIVGMAWMFCNNSSRRVRTIYFPLDPGRAWIHALWVHPDYRGLGLGQTLIVWGARTAIQVMGNEAILETNILPSNAISLRVFEKLGFTAYGHLYLIRWAKWNFAWKIHAR